jgi:uncharacterized protein (TIGR03083 family)
MMDIPTYIEHIRTDGGLLADAAAAAGLDAAVPTCPEWNIRDLVRHQGDVHRWAAHNLGRGKATPPDGEEDKACLLTWPDDDAWLLDWFREGHAHLLSVLESTTDDVVAFAFLPAPNARTFWARRQAHETAIHRADAQSAVGAITAYDGAFAADGIDEMLRGFASRPGRVTAESEQQWLIDATDADQQWLVVVTPEGLSVSDELNTPDTALRGAASDLYLLLWNRGDASALDVTDDGFLGLWQKSPKVRWSGPTRKE